MFSSSPIRSSGSPTPKLDPALRSDASAWSTPAPKKRQAMSSDYDEESTPASKKTRGILKTPKRSRQKNPNKPSTRAQTIPRSYADCEPHDKMLLDQRDAGVDWPTIRREWKRLTGEEVGASTLPNRYTRLKLNFTSMPQTDKALLLLCKKDVEDEFEAKKWGLIAKEMFQRGGGSGGGKRSQRYEGAVVKLQFKNLMLNADTLDFARNGMIEGEEDVAEEVVDVGAAALGVGGEVEVEDGEEFGDDEEGGEGWSSLA